jgi:hypothetical protein
VYDLFVIMVGTCYECRKKAKYINHWIARLLTSQMLWSSVLLFDPAFVVKWLDFL